MPPKNCLTTTIATKAPIGIIHKGSVDGKLKASKSPVTTALKSLIVLSRLRIFLVMYSNSTQETTLIIFMGIDYISGVIVAGVFHKSTKTETGGLNSLIGWKGRFKKGLTLAIVLVAHRLDLLIGTNYIRDAVIIALCANELISIIENAGLIGIPIPTVITKAIEVLKSEEKL